MCLICPLGSVFAILIFLKVYFFFTGQEEHSAHFHPRLDAQFLNVFCESLLVFKWPQGAFKQLSSPFVRTARECSS